MIYRIVVTLITSCAIALSGCYVSTAPKTVLASDARHVPSLISAPWSGKYFLYRIPEHPRGAIEEAGQPIASVHLEKGEYLGFKRHAPVAVAGGQEFSLGDGRYEWVMEADPHQLDPMRTTIVVVVVVIVVLVVAGVLFVVGVDSALAH